MAALSDIPLARVVDLRQVRSGDLDVLLEEEVDAWARKLRWDFRPSVELVRRFVDMQALAGFALIQANRVVGYVYYVCEERKGLIGDLYVLDSFRSTANENLLLNAALEALFAAPFVNRVESQLMMIGQPLSRTLPMPSNVRVFARNFMECHLQGASGLHPCESPGLRFAPWSDADQDEAARVIAESYEGHVDSRINDQYRSSAGARRFLLNIVQYPGCGSFFQPGSFVATERATGRMCGICLSSLVSPHVGHITQICVTPAVRATRTGYSLLRRALIALETNHCPRVSLTVTSTNSTAIALYEQMGFRTTRNFAAYVWDRP